MYLERLSLLNFKNYPDAELAFSPRVNCFVGDNGEGKTNLLDAIYYLSFCKSFFNPIDSQNIRHGEEFFMLQGAFQREEKAELIACSVKRQQKKQFRRNKKEYSRLADHIGLLPLVMVSPADHDLIHLGSEVRRKLIDGVIAQYDKPYLDHLLSYNRVLTQRNALLKRFAETRSFDATTLEIWDVQLAEHGQAVHRGRQEFLKAFTDIFQRYFSIISNGKEQVALDYVSRLNEQPLEALLAEAQPKDRMVQHTTVGVHKDDLRFLLGEHPLKKFGSQGQQKSYLLALRLAQFAFIKS
ncbi:MAG: DNA replication and repair protein RecF, partial [Bacteroidota bacterium]